MFDETKWRLMSDAERTAEIESFDDRWNATVELLSHRTANMLRAADRACDSPIERLFASSWLAHYANTHFEVLVSCRGKKLFTLGRSFGAHDVARATLEMQSQIGKHRVDFAITHGHPDGDIIRIVVECDGHDFHEKTKKQAASDKRRDRELMSAGWLVVRFTGSELYADPDDCVSEVLNIIGTKAFEQYELRQKLHSSSGVAQ